MASINAKDWRGTPAVWAYVTLTLGASVLIILLYLLGWGVKLSTTLEPSRIRHESGAQYIAPPPEYLGGLFSEWFSHDYDDAESGTGSRAKLFENSTRLHPAHSDHQDISKLGGGRFSHWLGSVRFSASDSTDPRVNGRVYTLVQRHTLSWVAALPLLSLSILMIGLGYYRVFSHLKASVVSILRNLPKLYTRPRYRLGGRWACILFVLGVFLLIISLFLRGLGITVSTPLEPSRIAHESGAQYVAPQPEYVGGIFSTLFAYDYDDVSFASSQATLLEGATPLGPAHSYHQHISDLGGGRFSFWKENIRFSASDSSDPRVNGRVYTAIQPHRLATPVFFGLTLMSSIMIYLGWSRLPPRAKAMVGNAVLRLPLVLYGSLAFMSAVYLGITIYSLWRGYAVPAASIFVLFPDLKWLAFAERYFPYFFILAGSIGYIFSCFSRKAPPPEAVARRLDAVTVRGFSFVGLPLLIALMFLSVGSWTSGAERLADLHFVSIGGIFPFSDPANYISCAFQQAEIGRWSQNCDWRPIASAFRVAVMILGGYDHNASMLVQAALLAGALFVAVRVVGMRYGAWAMLVFAGLALLQAKPFVGTVLTEPLAAAVAFLAIACTVEAWHRRDPVTNAAAVGLTTMALLMRMGSMFTVPALFAWTLWRFRARWRAAVFAVGLALVSVVSLLGTSKALVNLYGVGSSQMGGNYAALFFGLTVGGYWFEAERRHGPELAKLATDADRSAFLYRKSWENIVADPSVFFGRLGYAMSVFLTQLPDFMLAGYTGFVAGFAEPIRSDHLRGFYILVALSLLLRLKVSHWTDATRDMISYIGLFMLGLLVSVPLVILEDGWRTLHISYLFLVFFLSLCFSTERSSAPGAKASPYAGDHGR